MELTYIHEAKVVSRAVKFYVWGRITEAARTIYHRPSEMSKMSKSADSSATIFVG